MQRGKRRLARGGQTTERKTRKRDAEGEEEASIRRANDSERKKQKRYTEGEVEASERRVSEREREG